MTVVVDTSILIDHLRGKESARRLLADAFDRGDRLTASVVTKVEILAGVRDHEREATSWLLHQFEWIGVDEQLAERAGALAQQWIKSHPGVEVVDYLIAATVERLNATLWTLNGKHFPMFADLIGPYDSL